MFILDVQSKLCHLLCYVCTMESSPQKVDSVHLDVDCHWEERFVTHPSDEQNQLIGDLL